MSESLSSHKTMYSPENAAALIKDNLGIEPDRVGVLAGGESSLAYEYVVEGKEGVLRVNRHGDEGFHRDKYAYEHFRSLEVPVPKVLSIGATTDGMFYSFTEKIPGVTLDKLTPDDNRRLMPNLIRTLNAVHDTDIKELGFGHIGVDGVGKFDSWKDYLMNEIGGIEDGVEQVPFHDVVYTNQIKNEAVALIKDCPEIRRLVHIDFGYNNTITNNGKISGVIDWEQAAYGDPVWDVAWLDFWSGTFSEPVDYVGSIKNNWQKVGKLDDDFDVRMRCYQLIIGAGSLGFFARSGQHGPYQYVIDKLQNM